jgi:lipopolysaccharide transport system ATP-binding protein
MYARLGFAVAVHVNPDILIVDEVLAVGDLAFQARCLGRMAEMKRAGTTIVIVSHQLPRVRRLCDRGIFLYRGEVLVDGPIEEAITLYQNNPEYASNLARPQEARLPSREGQEQPRSSLSPDSPMAITGVSLLDGDARPMDTCRTADRLVLRIGFVALRPVDLPVFEVWIHASDGTEYAAFTTQWDGYPCDGSPGSGHVDLVLDPLCLVPGRYALSVAITASDGITRYDWHWQRYGLDVRSDRYLQGLVFLPHTWASARETARPPSVPPAAAGGRV